MVALLIGLALVAFLGFFHHVGMMAIRRMAPSVDQGSQIAMIGGFCSRLVLHTLEILLFAAAYRWLLSWPWMGSLGANFDGTWSGLIYYSGMNFVTLGYASLDAEGPIRLVSMMESLGGFMVITWSATFIYSLSQAAWDRSAS